MSQSDDYATYGRTGIEIGVMATITLIMVSIIVAFSGSGAGSYSEAGARTMEPEHNRQADTPSVPMTSTSEVDIAVTTTSVAQTTTTTMAVPAPVTTTPTAPIADQQETTTTIREAPLGARAELTSCSRAGAGTKATVAMTQDSGPPSRYNITVAFKDEAGSVVASSTRMSGNVSAYNWTVVELTLQGTPARGYCEVMQEPQLI